MFHPLGPTFRDLVDQALVGTEAGYDMLAGRFDYTPFRTPDPLVAGVVRVAGEHGPVGAAIDLCCGTGAGVEGLRPIVRNRLVGIDFSAGMLKEAEVAVRRSQGTAPVELVRGDVLTYPFRAEFDVATCFGALGHFDRDQHASFAAQIHRSLVPGGRFLCATPERVPPTSRAFWVYNAFNAVMRVRNALIKPPFIMYYLQFLAPEATKVLEAAGFSVELRRGVFPAPYERFVVLAATKK
jgi:ubiquinone/menaquinone biosynthesis C-methylase UbiE